MNKRVQRAAWAFALGFMDAMGFVGMVIVCLIVYHL